ncbi:glycoside hydrolase family 3 N-terminal domain-containing protein [Anaerocolumna sp. AGMB13020]|uniref:glycoside hydrolase family 3 protein n=1 Tax=Anaerocolumna sp. AGMB13020 TaxID=3081750 RepID=UPI0029537D81|nr:glycoside hydrolase family 3 N-terminal domain-containing protein [Anaerocolumna sp. AGMB13020]WOO37590.1 glycoside hydrolase family 3 N-terminal domain-containing protein [Anaerocolumna sp. AGMB13020]
MKIYDTKESRLLLAKKLAAEGIVLLKNDNSLLPLKPGTPVAVFGRAQLDTLIGGSGSGASSSEDTTLILDEFIKAGLKVDSRLEAFYRSSLKAEKEKAPAPEEERAKFTELLNSGMIYEIFGKYKAPAEEYSVPPELIAAIPSFHTAVLILGRGSGGEECDRRIDEDYYLTASEKELLHKVASHFQQVVLVLNVNGFIDLSQIQSCSSINSLLFLGTAGEQGAAALAEVVTGKVTPSGKLPSTMAYSYEEYPSAELFFTDKDRAATILTYEDFGLSAGDNHSTGFEKSPVAFYKEGIYVGYRYFDTFNVPVMYPFGHGLSYAAFLIENTYVSREGNSFLVNVKVTNQSDSYSGKEVLQLYVSAPSLLLEKPYQELLTYIKTDKLKPKEAKEFALSFSLKELANYDEASAAYIIEKGSYFLRLGNSSRNTHIIGRIQVTETIVTEHVANRLGISPVNKEKLTFLSNKEAAPYTYEGEAEEKEKAPCLLTLNQTIFDTNISAPENSTTAKDSSFLENGQKLPTLKDVRDGLLSMEAFVKLLSVEELAVLLNGYGPGLPFGGMGGKYSSTIQYEDGSDIGVSTHPTGFPGYISPALAKYGIPSVFYKDGPAGVQMTAWPTGISMACTFNNELLQEFGAACASEALELQVDSWLAPGINLHRNPIGGRNFEYYSEDPRHTGFCGLHITLGAEEAGVTTCPKHFALNEQETYRRGSTKNSFDALDSIVEERAARELYLKPFEMVIKNSKVSTIMTSFNKINGIFAAGNKELCEGILREEWGYEGIVVTDWGDMDIVVDGADAIAAGNDIIMPGGPPVIDQVIKGYKEGRVTLADLQTSAMRFLRFVMNSNSCKKYWEETNT